jgi:hypothetical protein
MCNLHSMTKNQAANRNLFKVDRDLAGNLPPLDIVARGAKKDEAPIL